MEDRNRVYVHNAGRLSEVVRSKDRRFKILEVAPEVVLVAVFSSGDAERKVSIQGLPDGCEIDGVIYSEYGRCFAFRLRHPSFAEVPDNTEPERFSAELIGPSGPEVWAEKTLRRSFL